MVSVFVVRGESDGHPDVRGESDGHADVRGNYDGTLM